MANIKTTIDTMAKKNIVFDAPAPADPSPKPELAATKIKAVATEMAQPWLYGHVLQRFAKKHEISMTQVREIYKAVKERLEAEGTPMEEPTIIEELP